MGSKLSHVIVSQYAIETTVNKGNVCTYKSAFLSVPKVCIKKMFPTPASSLQLTYGDLRGSKSVLQSLITNMHTLVRDSADFVFFND